MPPLDDLRERFNLKTDTLSQSLTPELLIALSFLAGSGSTILASRLYTRHIKRIQNHDWVTPDMISRKRWLKGLATSVGDGDNFRFYHTPGLGWRWPIKFRRVPVGGRELKDQTIHIRIAGVDAPECAHFGKPGQPHSEESLAWLRQRILGKTVYCRLLQRDQYNRIIAHVSVKRRFLPWGSSLAVEMLREGMAGVYEQAGAQYGPGGKAEFLRVEAEAKAARRGMWKSGLGGETPAEYKRRYGKESPSQAQEGKKVEEEEQVPRKGLFSRLFGR